MTPHERDLILRVADEIRAADRSAIDPEAERLIRTEVASQPHAAYLLTQRVIAQDLGLRQAQQRIAELEGRMRQAGIAPSSAGGGFLGGQGGSPPGAGPAQQPGAAAPQHSGVGDFLRSAAAAAAGAIGGNLIYDGIRHWAGEHGTGHGGDWLGGSGGTSGGGFIPTEQGGGRYDQGQNWGDDFVGGGGGSTSGDADFGSSSDDDFQTDDTADDLDDQGGDWADNGSNDGAGGDW